MIIPRVSMCLFLLQALLLSSCHLTRGNNSTIGEHCADLNNFYYEIVLSVTSFPQAACTNAEEVDISNFLQTKLNQAQHHLPGTIQNKNKLCSRAVNTNRRHRRYLEEDNNNLSWGMNPDKTPHEHEHERKSFFSLMKSALRNLIISREDNSDDMQLDHRSLTLHKRSSGKVGRNFIYVGGGRCRFCFMDNQDTRDLLYVIIERKDQQDDDDDDGPPPTIPTVKDWKDCRGRSAFTLLYDDFENGKMNLNWRNGKVLNMGKNSSIDSFLGPYVPGDSFGVIVKGVGSRKKEAKSKSKQVDVHPVAGAVVEFYLWEIDIPPNYAQKMWGDDPLYLYINGIKIDLGLLVAASYVHKNKNAGGRSFAGIEWNIEQMKETKNYGFGPQVDREYFVQLEIPKIIFEHSNEIDIQFYIKHDAKAKQYGIGGFHVMVDTWQCKIIGEEDSPFEEFKAATERKLRDKLTQDITKEFQNKTGHCLNGKTPVVDIHLVEKEKWSTANPRCSS